MGPQQRRSRSGTILLLGLLGVADPYNLFQPAWHNARHHCNSNRPVNSTGMPIGYTSSAKIGRSIGAKCSSSQ